MRNIIKCIFIVLIMLFSINLEVIADTNIIFIDENPSEENFTNYRKIDDLLKELKEERKIIEQQRLQEIEQKRLEKQSQNEDSNIIKKEQPKDNSKNTQNDLIPKLIVRLRGKHSAKYLCEYKIIISDESKERELSKEVITDYNILLKKPSLKVRPGEIINFEFVPEAKSIKAYLLREDMASIKVKRGCITVPDIDGKAVILIEGTYNNGYIKYAIVLDIRKE